MTWTARKIPRGPVRGYRLLGTQKDTSRFPRKERLPAPQHKTAVEEEMGKSPLKASRSEGNLAASSPPPEDSQPSPLPRRVQSPLATGSFFSYSKYERNMALEMECRDGCSGPPSLGPCNLA